ncbi:hypothetical protein NC77_25900 [Janthinobacterium lividum]|nr:hypothetical protein NC77_25900 [Janthinobacterium lividum]
MQAVRRAAVPSRQTITSHPVFILHCLQLGHFVSMYGNCFKVVCIKACSNTNLEQTLLKQCFEVALLTIDSVK